MRIEFHGRKIVKADCLACLSGIIKGVKLDLNMKIKYRNNTLQPNHSLYCIDCDIYDYAKSCKSCFGLCAKTRISSGFSVINDCEVLEL